MKHRSSGRSRRATPGGTDGSSLEAALVASSLLLWIPYSLAAIYVAYCSSFITEVPLSLTGSPPSSVSAAAAGGSMTASVTRGTSSAQAFASSTTAAAAAVAAAAASSPATSFVPPDVAVMSTGSVVDSEAATLHRYSSLYYYAFPADFSIAAFVPLLLRVLPFSVLAVTVTFYLAVYRYNGGEYLMAVAWALGTCSGYGWLTTFTGSVQPTFASSGSAKSLLVSATPPSWMWLVVSLLTGLFSGILCKVKDIVDGKHDRDTHFFHIFDRSDGGRAGKPPTAPPTTNPSEPLADDGSRADSAPRRRQRTLHGSTSHHLVSLGDRLYMVVPFCTGQWFAFIVQHGWRGIVVENGTILLSLGLVGYTMLSYKYLKRQVLRASGRVTRSVAARGRSRRNQRLRQQQQQQRQQTPASARSGEDLSTTSTPSAEGAPRSTSAENSSMDSNSANVSPRAAAGPALSEDDAEEEITEFFEDVGEAAFIDVIDLISKLFTTSFGVVVAGVVGLNIFMTSLCIPFLKALFKLNALVSGVGIVIELIMYEVA